jgi:hypothetical protein
MRLPLYYRPNLAVTTDHYRRVARWTCLHFDAWIKANHEGHYYLTIEQRAGGRLSRGKGLPPEQYRIGADGALYPASEGDVVALPINVMIDAVDGVTRDVLMNVHREYVLPWATRMPAGFRSRSCCLHYWLVNDEPAVVEGTYNYCTRGGMVAGPVVYEREHVEHTVKTPHSGGTGGLGALGTKNDIGAIRANMGVLGHSAI